MKVVVDLTALADNFTGMERYALNLVKELLEQNKDCQFVLIFKERIHEAFLKYKDFSFAEILVLPRKSKLWFYQITLFGTLRKINADIFFFPAFPAPFFLRKKGIVNTIFDLGCWDCPQTMTWKMVQYFRLMYRNAAHRSSRIVTISEFSRMRIQEILRVSPDKILVAYCAVSERFYQDDNREWNEIRRKYNLPEKYILSLSTLEPRKNLKLLIDAYGELKENDSCGYDLVLAGRKGWKMDDVLSHIPQNAAAAVHITGYVDEDDLPSVYDHAELFVFPSLYEGFGIPPLEAMARGVPVLCSDIDVLREVLGDKAQYFESNNRESLREKLKQCLNGDQVFPSRQELTDYSRKYSYRTSAEALGRILSWLQMPVVPD